jgi:broad specificity phosphatase PhoE
MNRREVLRLAAASGIWVLNPSFAQTSLDLPALLRKGSCVVMLRHAQTEPGIGDPPGYRLDQCSTQRNLSQEGREQARQIGQWFKANRLQPSSVQSSIWCRCKDTAELAFGPYQVLGALASTFDDRSGQESQTRELRARLTTIPVGQFEVWVTHQVNITALIGEVPAMGEAVLVSSEGKLQGRTFFTR